MRLGKQSRLRVETLEDRSLPSAAFVSQWNDLLLDVRANVAAQCESSEPVEPVEPRSFGGGCMMI